MTQTTAPQIETPAFDAAMERLLVQPTIDIPDTMLVTGLGEHSVRKLVAEGEIATAKFGVRNIRVLSAPLRAQLGLD